MFLSLTKQNLQLLGLLALASLSASAVAQSGTAPAGVVAKPRVEAFAALPLLRELQLSPDGARLLGVMNREGTSVLITSKADGSEMSGILESDNLKFQITWARWVNNKRLIVAIRYPGIRPGSDTAETRLLAIDADGSNLLNLIPPGRGGQESAQLQDDVVDMMPDDGKHILLSLLEDRQLWAPGVYKVNVETGKRELVMGPRRFVWDWVTDKQHRVRAGVRRDGTSVEIIACDPSGENWRTLWRFESFEAGSVYPLGFGKDPYVLYVRADHQGRAAIFEARLDQLDAAGKPKMTLRQADPQHDVSGDLVFSRASGEPIGVGQVDLGRADQAFWSEPLKELARGIDQALPERFNRFQSFSEDENSYVLRSSGNGVPDKVFVGNRQKGSLALLADFYPDLASIALTGKRQMSFKARDGLALNAYLTQPKGVTSGPLVLLPHGGPVSRDNLDFDATTAFLASRGYSVLQVDFRGSDGYGREFRNAGLKRWGLEMQDDLTDAVQWAIQEKLADPRRICIVGGSYGGYAALMGAVKTPELYRCAVSLAGPTSLLDMARRDPAYYDGPSMGDRPLSMATTPPSNGGGKIPTFVNEKTDYLKSSLVVRPGGQRINDKQLGDYWKDKDRLKATSPLEHAAEIKVPVLLVHGSADRQVGLDQSEKMAAALKSAGKEVRLVTLVDADHQLSRQNDRVEFLAELEKFLDRHIGAGAN